MSYTTTVTTHGRVCTGCNVFKSWKYFYKSSKQKTGYEPKCKLCRRTVKKVSVVKRRLELGTEGFRARERSYERSYRDKDPARAKKKDFTQSLKKYGLTPEGYGNILVQQDNKCAVCLKPETAMLNGVIKNLAVDHDHSTNEVRGLLCSKCNTALGLLDENIERILSLKEYLERYA